jgi:hypothetical protein
MVTATSPTNAFVTPMQAPKHPTSSPWFSKILTTTTTREHRALQPNVAYTWQQRLQTPTFVQIPRRQWGKAVAFAFFCINPNFQIIFSSKVMVCRF